MSTEATKFTVAANEAAAYVETTGEAFRTSALRNVAAIALYALIERRSNTARMATLARLTSAGMADSTARRQTKSGWEIATRISQAMPDHARIVTARNAATVEAATDEIIRFFSDMNISDAHRDGLLWAEGNGAPLTIEQKAALRVAAQQAALKQQAAEIEKAEKRKEAAEKAAEKAEQKLKETIQLSRTVDEKMSEVRAEWITDFIANPEGYSPEALQPIVNYVIQAAPYDVLQSLSLAISNRMGELSQSELKEAVNA